MNARRRKEVSVVREEGRQAARTGRHPQTNPYPISNSNWYQWHRGYDEGIMEQARQEPNEEDLWGV